MAHGESSATGKPHAVNAVAALPTDAPGSAGVRTVRRGWLPLSIISVLCFGGWGIFGKLGSTEISAWAMQFIFALGVLPVAPALFFLRPKRPDRSTKGIAAALASGVLSGIAGMAFYEAFRVGGHTSVVTATTALYPMITVLLAVKLLGETLTKTQWVGLAFALLAIVLFAISLR